MTLFRGKSGAYYGSEENRDICELALELNRERGGGQGILATLQEAELMRRLAAKGQRMK